MDDFRRPARSAPASALGVGARPQRAQALPPSINRQSSSGTDLSAPSYYAKDPQPSRPPLMPNPYANGSDLSVPAVAGASSSRVQFSVLDASRANLLGSGGGGGGATGEPPSGGASSSQNPHHLSSNDTSATATGLSAAGNGFRRKKSLVRPDRERVDESHRLYNYRQHAAVMELEGRGVAAVSRTGHTATAGLSHVDPSIVAGNSTASPGSGTGLRRGKSVLGREEGMATETGLSMFKRGTTLRRPNNLQSGASNQAVKAGGSYEKSRMSNMQKQPLGPWMVFCRVVTILVPSALLKCFGLRSKDRRDAWREKIGMLCIIATCMAAVGFLTFGFTSSVCGTPPLRYRHNTIQGGSMIFHGYDYDLNNFTHVEAYGIGAGTNPLYSSFGAGGMDGSFLFQKVNEKCLDIITPTAGTGIPTSGNKLGWYFPCNLYNQYGTSTHNLTGYSEGRLCHTQADARTAFSKLKSQGQVYFEWSDLKNASRNLGVYDGAVLDFSLLTWLDKTQVTFPPIFDALMVPNSTFTATDITAHMVSTKQRRVAECLVDTIRVGFVDSNSIGCVASDVVLYVSLVVIIGVVVIRFAMAVIFGWFLSWKIGRFPQETYEQRRARASEIENWTQDIYRPAPARFRPNVKLQRKSMLPNKSRFSRGDLLKAHAAGSGVTSPRAENKYGEYRKSMAPSLSSKNFIGGAMRNSPPGSPGGLASPSSASFPPSVFNYDMMSRSPTGDSLGNGTGCPFPLGDVIAQPPADYQPFNYPLVHSILLVTAYSESIEGLRTTLDSLSTTDYPNSHKVILVIADGMVKGSGNRLTTPEIVLGMMKELVVPVQEVEPQSYVAIADGHKAHNQAKIFAGFYDYDNNTVEMSKQQRVPIVLVAKIGNPSEANDPKPGNRGKRDSQVMLVSFLQKVMFDERMTTFEYEFFNSLWRCTGISPDRYEVVLMVDADTKIFPDSVSRMISCMVHDPEIMGLCGETKIANKSETWVTMIQVFEYYVSHHLTKAFESMFGGVTCLPGCFSMYRIKAPKGADGYWVPVLANPDIVMHYSENVVDTLHKKNLLLLGEDRYLTTLMLSTFPRRKMMFCPQAVCKTVVPDTFRVLLSQRRRWINSTIHNLFELFKVPDLCGVFCFSMRFVIFMELAAYDALRNTPYYAGTDRTCCPSYRYLIVIAIIPGTTKPVLSLILLAIILGIPAILIVVTSRKVEYLGWMMIYLLSLPIWNFVLPVYAFLHMDDFSWGQTRKVAGDDGRSHSDKDGTFDSSNIVMKRWADFERDRRYRAGTLSRDSAYDVLNAHIRHGSPHRSTSYRHSIVSTDTYNSLPASASLSTVPRYPTQLELPAPLAQQVASAHSSTTSFHNGHAHEYPRFAEGYDSDELEREAILSEQQRSSPALDSTASFPAEVGRNSTPDESQGRSGRSSNIPSASNATDTSRPARQPSKPRGVSLVDAGPVPGSEGVRVVQRTRRPSQQGQTSSHQRSRPSQGGQDAVFSPTSGGGSLPPGAAPPQL
ncbi:BQ5605_C020g09085 [Microbotryum silenes-dioicae]|uniref:chitin synthase n=1 Tax=Microbotryum silenes-dioicae TaxID=796604 RepID=A0A2X0PJG9_9BASI|nr:BQ5605_C020g09085 [Microbotryum silenes-dioicae]